MAAEAPLLQQMGTTDFSDVKSVGVIGAGVSGLQMARACAAHGLTCKVFDKAPDIGGLWRVNYHSYGVQVPKQLYEFPDYPFDAVPWGQYPTGAETQAYIKSYAENFGLNKYVTLSTEVKQLKPRKDGQKGYTFVLKAEDGAESEEDFDFAVVCSGMYSQVANMPTWTEDMGDFTGEVIHSSKYTDQAIAKGKRVIVVGNGKSAHDCTESASGVAKEPPLMLFREAHWSTPRLIAGLIPFQYVFLSRLGQALVSWYKGGFPSGAPCYCTCCCYILYPIMYLAFLLVAFIFRVQRGHWGDYGPKSDLVSDFFGYATVLDTSFLKKWRAKQLNGKKGEVARLVKDGVELKSGEKLEADLIICATGFRKTYDYLPEETKKALDPQSDGLWLYRHMLPANVRSLNLAFCGSEVATITNIMTHAIHAEYICRVLTHRITLPSEEDMKKEIERMKAWKRSWMPETSSRAALVLLYQTHYHDQLLSDMGLRAGRKCGPCELLCPYGPHDYDNVISEGIKPAASGEP